MLMKTSQVQPNGAIKYEVPVVNQGGVYAQLNASDNVAGPEGAEASVEVSVFERFFYCCWAMAGIVCWSSNSRRSVPPCRVAARTVRPHNNPSLGVEQQYVEPRADHKSPAQGYRESEVR